MSSFFRRVMTALGGGLIGSLLFALGNLLFGGSNDSAMTASFYGFWIFAIIGFIAGGRKAGA